MLIMASLIGLFALCLLSPMTAAAETNVGHPDSTPNPPDTRDAAGVAAGAAAAEVVIKVISGLSSWINNQSDDCYAACLGAAWGKDCDTDVDEESNTGYVSVFVQATGENDCAYGYGQGLAQESPFGSWAGSTVDPFALAFTLALHDTTPKDFHKGRGWAKCGVDNHVRAKTKETPKSFLVPDSLPGEVLARISIDSLTFSTVRGRSQSIAKWDMFVMIDSVIIFESSGSMNQGGNVTVTGDIPAGQFDDSSNSNGWFLYLHDYVIEIPICTLQVTRGDSADMGVSLQGDMEAKASKGDDAMEPDSGACVSSTMSCFGVMTHEACDRIGGYWQGPGTRCVAMPVVEPNPLNCLLGAPMPTTVLIYVGDMSGDYTATDIDPASLLVNGSISPLSWLPSGNVSDVGDVWQLRVSLADLVGSYPLWWETSQQTFTITGSYHDGLEFETTGYFTALGYIPGDCNLDGEVNVGDVVMIIQYVFRSGQAPTPIETADANGDGTANVGDAVYLINYIFNGGSAPVHR
jgi:hypothetical protein